MTSALRRNYPGYEELAAALDALCDFGHPSNRNLVRSLFELSEAAEIEPSVRSAATDLLLYCEEIETAPLGRLGKDAVAKRIKAVLPN